MLPTIALDTPVALNPFKSGVETHRVVILSPPHVGADIVLDCKGRSISGSPH